MPGPDWYGRRAPPAIPRRTDLLLAGGSVDGGWLSSPVENPIGEPARTPIWAGLGKTAAGLAALAALAAGAWWLALHGPGT
jgi:hypothetical protein